MTYVVISDRPQNVSDGVNDIRLYSNPAAVRLSQQYAEIINSGDANKVRVSQLYAEIINSGNANKVRVSQQYLEIIHTFGSLPPGKSDAAPGHNKPPPAVTKWLSFIEREVRHRKQRNGRFSNPDVVIYSSDYLPPNPIPIRRIEVIKNVRID